MPQPEMRVELDQNARLFQLKWVKLRVARVFRAGLEKTLSGETAVMRSQVPSCHEMAAVIASVEN
jgi:hypothetical protein